MTRTELGAASRLEFGEILRSRWMIFSLSVYAVLMAGLLIAATRESSVFGFAGMDRVLFSFAHVLLVVLPILAIGTTMQAINRARDDGTIELLFSHPISRRGYFTGLSLVRLASLVAPFLVAVVVALVVALVLFRDVVSATTLLQTVLVGVSLSWAFVGLGLAISTGIRNQAKAVVTGLGLWIACVALLDIALVGTLLRWGLPARGLFILASLNPVQAARLALLSSLDPELGRLGPMGFYLRHQIGAAWLFVIGVAWPLVLGTLSWRWALARFERGDLV